MKQRRGMILLCALLIATCMAGCAYATDANSTEQLLFGQITAIDGNTLTLTVASMPGGAGDTPPDGVENGQRPEFQNGPQEGGQGDQQSGMPGGEPPEMAGGQQGEQPSESQGMAVFAGEEVSRQMTDATTITVKSGETDAQGTPADLSIGDMVQLTAADGQIVGLALMRGGAEKPADIQN